MPRHLLPTCALVGFALSAANGSSAQTAAAQAKTAPASANTAPAAIAVSAGVALPTDYVIGPDDVLNVVFWRDKDLSSEVVVRPDGKISLPLLNDIQAAGSTPEQLRQRLVEAANRYVEDPTATVVVKQINSRKVFITGLVAKPGPYPLTTSMTVLQLIALSGGLQEYADSKNIVVLRPESGRTASFRVNYKDVLKRKNLRQNIELKPGDTVIVP